jgi:hypothetical protein
MYSIVATRTKCNQIFFRIITGVAAELFVGGPRDPTWCRTTDISSHRVVVRRCGAVCIVRNQAVGEAVLVVANSRRLLIHVVQKCLPLFPRLYNSQLPVVEQAIETAALMLGSDKSRGNCLEMICADFLAGANLENENPEILLQSALRFFNFLPRPVVAIVHNGVEKQEIRFSPSINRAASMICGLHLSCCWVRTLHQ